ncbi:MAG TPA: hypothetical protein VFI31_18300, partial [Pirellulales bacterium]|nr:hypothetical protein [Pirellulales bacterium]
MLTVVLFSVVAALPVLANLTGEIEQRRWPLPQNAPAKPMTAPATASDGVFDVREPDHSDPTTTSVGSFSFGWPLLWNQYVVLGGG